MREEVAKDDSLIPGKSNGQICSAVFWDRDRDREEVGGAEMSSDEYCLVCVKVKVKSLSRVRLFATPWTVAYQSGSSIHGIFQARVLEWIAWIQIDMC